MRPASGVAGQRFAWLPFSLALLGAFFFLAGPAPRASAQTELGGPACGGLWVQPGDHCWIEGEAFRLIYFFGLAVADGEAHVTVTLTQDNVQLADCSEARPTLAFCFGQTKADTSTPVKCEVQGNDSGAYACVQR